MEDIFLVDMWLFITRMRKALFEKRKRTERNPSKKNQEGVSNSKDWWFYWYHNHVELEM